MGLNAKVERVVLNALRPNCGFAAGYLRLRRVNSHRLEDKTIHTLPQVERVVLNALAPIAALPPDIAPSASQLPSS